MSDIHTWARLVKTLEDIPEEFANIYNSLIVSADVLPYMIYSPSVCWGSRRTNDKLTCMHNGRLTVFQNTRDGIINSSYLPEDIDYVRRRSILLHSWMNISGVSGSKAVDTTIEYNTVVKELFKPIIDFLRGLPSQVEKLNHESNLESLDKFNKLEYRFRHYARDCVNPGTEVISMCFQNTIYKKKKRFLKKTLSNSHLSLLTDKEWIYINEGELISAETQKYEDIYTFIKLDKLKKIEIVEEQELLRVKLHLKGESEVSMTYEKSGREEFGSFIAKLRILNPKLYIEYN